MDSQSKISWQLIHPHCWKMLGGHSNKMFTASSLSSLQLIYRIYQKNISSHQLWQCYWIYNALHLAKLSQWVSFPGQWGEILFYCSTLSTLELHSYTVVQTVKGLANDRLTRDYEFVRPGSGESSDTRCEAITSVLVYPLRQSQWVEDNFLLFTSPG